MIASIFVLSKGADHVFFLLLFKKKGWNLKYLGRRIPWCSSVIESFGIAAVVVVVV